MSNTGVVPGCLHHPDDRFIQVRKDFFDICVYDKSQFNQKKNTKGNPIRDEPNQECMAKILRLIESLTDTMRTNWYTNALNAKQARVQIHSMPKEFAIELAYSAISTLLYNTYGESTIRNSISCLIQWNYITRIQETIGSIPKYIINVEVVQAAIDKQYQEDQKRELNSTPPFKKPGRPKKGVENNTGGVQIQHRGVLKITAGGSENNTNNIVDKNTNKNIHKKEETPSSQKPQEIASSSEPLVKTSDQIFQWWDEINEKKTSRSPKQKETAQFLAEKQVTKQDLLDQKAWCWNNDPAWHEKNGLQLSYLQHTWDAWQQSKAHQIAPECPVEVVVEAKGAMSYENVQQCFSPILEAYDEDQQYYTVLEIVETLQGKGINTLEQVGGDVVSHMINQAQKAPKNARLSTLIGLVINWKPKPQGQQQRLA